MTGYPVLLHTVLDARDPRALADFYREFLGLTYRPDEGPPAAGEEDDVDWIVLVDEAGHRVLAIQEKEDLLAATWPSEEVPMQLHLDFEVDSVGELHLHRHRAERLGARLLLDRSDDAEEPLYVLADPEGHPFCLLTEGDGNDDATPDDPSSEDPTSGVGE